MSRKYSILDMVRFGLMVKENQRLRPFDLIKKYNEKYPEISDEQKMKNAMEFINSIKKGGYKPPLNKT